MQLLQLARLAVVVGVAAVGVGLLFARGRNGGKEFPDYKYPSRNWCQEFDLRNASVIHAPSSLDEIVHIVKEAGKNQQTITVVGSGHSFSAVQVPEDVAVSLHNYRGVVAMNLEKKQITVRAGTSMYDVMYSQLPQHNLSLATSGDYVEQSVAGALATGTHGSSFSQQSLSSAMVSAQLVIATGEVIRISEEENADLLGAVRLSLGLLGVITEITLQAVDEFHLARTVSEQHATQCIDNAVQLLERTEFNKIWVSPVTDYCMVFDTQRTEPREREVNPPVVEYLQSWANELVFWLFQNLPNFIGQPFLYAVIRLNGATKPVQEVAVARDLLTLPSWSPKHIEMEYAVPKDNTVAALKVLLLYLEEHDLKNKLMVIVVRSMKAEDGVWLSSGYRQDVVFITLLAFSSYIKLFRTHLTEFEKLMFELGANVHFGKAFSALPEPHHQENRPKWADFVQAKKRLDPAGIFGSRILRQTMASAFS